jgi:hypothetical protein
MTSFFRRSGTNLTDVLRVTADPAAEANVVKVYSKIAYGITQLFARVSDGTVYQITPTAAGSTVKGIYGDGSDGALTVVGTVTMTRDMYFTALTVPAGATLITAGYRVFAKTSIVVEGTIHNNGSNGSGATGGASGASGSLRSGGSGGTSTVSGAGSGGASQQLPSNYTGTAGAGGSSSTGGGGVAGSRAFLSASNLSDPRYSMVMSVGWTLAQGSNAVSAGPGGGSGRGNGAVAGGGGGGGGGLVTLCSPIIDNSIGAIQARGGSGASTAAVNCGGGGGGAGGIVYLVTDSYVGTLPDVSGGAAGAGTGATPAQAGTAGLVVGPLAG